MTTSSRPTTDNDDTTSPPDDQQQRQGQDEDHVVQQQQQQQQPPPPPPEASSSKIDKQRNDNVSRAQQQQQQQHQAWPEDTLNDAFFVYRLYQRWTYSYMTPLLAKGQRQERDGFRLTADDLFLPPVTMTSNVLVDKFRRHYYNDHPPQPPPTTSNSNNNTTALQTTASSNKKKKKKNKSKHSKRSRNRYTFWRRTLWNLAAPTFVPAGFFALLTILCQVSIPLLVRQLLILLEEHAQENILRQGLPLAVAMFGVVLLNGLANHRHRHLAVKSGIVMRAALVNMLYHQVLQLSPRGRVGLTSGEVTTLVALDTQKLLEVTQEGHMIWSLPLAMCLVTILLVLVMGPVTLVGILVLLLFLPCASWITSKMLHIRNRRVALTDHRIQVTSNMLQGIQVTKLHNYEDYYYKFIMDIRNRELALLRQEVAVWAMTLTLTVLSPALACAATFSAYVLLNESTNILTAAQTFTVLLLFSALRFPINYAGRLLGKAAQAMSAVERIVAFLERETQQESDDDDDVMDEGDDEPPTTVNGKKNAKESSSSSSSIPSLQLENAAFCIGALPRTIGSTSSSTGPVDEEENNNHHNSLNNSTHSTSRNNGTFTVSEFNLSVHKGQVLAVCGPVGSGKSTLIAGIIRQATPVATNNTATTMTTTTRGNVAYVSQSPFVLNATFRENILFGLPFDQERYEKVLDACCLHADIEQLGVSKDLTEIGERGVTLSGGTCIQVSLSSCIFNVAVFH
jgi:ABC-type multidrug transport system fused ATPase/permease subunit